MAIIGIDIGTTNMKVGIYRENGAPVAIASRPTVTRHAAEGFSYYEPEEMWGAILSALTEAAAVVAGTAPRAVEPDMTRHAEYQRIYQAGYLPLQAALRGYYARRDPRSVSTIPDPACPRPRIR